MGNWNSGRYGGRPTTERSLRIDLRWMLRTGRAKPGDHLRGSLSWSNRGAECGSISYRANMTDPDDSWLILTYRRGSGDDAENVEQHIRLVCTEPHYGGRRWWMVCPYGGGRAAILYHPDGGDRFASRKAWRLAYHSQRITQRDAAFEALYRVQRRLGCPEGWDLGIWRPKGMWWRTYERHQQEFDYWESVCSTQMALMVLRRAR